MEAFKFCRLMGCSYADWESAPAHFVDWSMGYAGAEARFQREQMEKANREAEQKSRWWRRGG